MAYLGAVVSMTASAVAIRPLDRIMLLAAWTCLPTGMFVASGLDPSLFREPFLLGLFLVLLAPQIALALRPRRWLLLAASVPIVLLALTAVASEAGESLAPADAYSFVSYLFLAEAFALAAVGGIGGFVAAQPSSPSTARWRHAAAWFWTATLVGATAVSLLAAAHAGVAEAYDFEPEASILVRIEEATHESFTPSQLDVVAGQITEIAVENLHGGQHTLSYEHGGQAQRHVVYGKSVARFLVLFDEPGSVRFWCDAHSTPDRAEGQVGEFRVAPADAASKA